MQVSLINPADDATVVTLHYLVICESELTGCFLWVGRIHGNVCSFQVVSIYPEALITTSMLNRVFAIACEIMPGFGLDKDVIKDGRFIPVLPKSDFAAVETVVLCGIDKFPINAGLDGAAA